MDSSSKHSVSSVLKNIKAKNFDNLRTIQERILKKVNSSVATQSEFEGFFLKKLLFRNFSTEIVFLNI